MKKGVALSISRNTLIAILLISILHVALTAAARTNYSIQTALGNAPENTRFPSGAGAYTNNYVSFGNVIIAGVSDTIIEIGLFGFWYWLAEVQDAYMLCRDVLGA
jgi:hypothetical protein